MGLFFFRLFLIGLGVWLGAGVFDALYSHFGWWNEPVRWIRFATMPEGARDPWPYITYALAGLTLVSWAFFAFRRRGGPLAMAALIVSTLLVAVSLVYFTPSLNAIMSGADRLSEEDIAAQSHLWIELNLARLGVAAIALYLGMMATQRWTPGGI